MEEKMSAKQQAALAAERAKQAALDLLAGRQPGFRWNIDGTIYQRNQLLEAVQQETKLGESIIELALTIEFEHPPQNQLGKRYWCPICGAIMLCTKPGAGRVSCCDQEMALQQPRKLPSSD